MSNVKEQKSIAGLRANAVAFLVSISFFMGLGLIFSLIALILEEENEFVRSYSKQTLTLSIFSLIAILLNVILFIGTILYGVLIAVLAVFQIIAAVSAISGKEFEIPHLNKLSNLLFAN